MSILEVSWIFQAESQHPIKADVGDPDQRQQQRRVLRRSNRAASQYDSTDSRSWQSNGQRPVPLG